MDHQFFIVDRMCKITEEMLWLPRLDWAKKKDPTVSLVIRVGTGKATYVRHSRGLAGKMTLTYGLKMVESKLNPDSLGRWTTGKEIRQRGYFGGEVNSLNVLTHTMVHEFGHVVQVLLGRRYDASVHNDEFYEILDKAYANGHAEYLRDRLHSDCLKQGIDLSKIFSNELTAADALDMGSIEVNDLVEVMAPSLAIKNPFQVLEKRRTKVSVRSVVNPEDSYSIPASGLREYCGETPESFSPVLSVSDIKEGATYNIMGSRKVVEFNPFVVLDKGRGLIHVRSQVNKRVSMKVRPWLLSEEGLLF